MQFFQHPDQSNANSLNTVRRGAGGYLGRKRGNIWKVKLMNLNQTVRSSISETGIGTSVTLRRVANLEHSKGWEGWCVQTLTMFWVVERIISLTYWMCKRLIIIGRAARAWEECCEVQIAIDKINRQKYPGKGRLPAERINAGGREIRCTILELINFICNKEELRVH
jgi:hypothetical protein